MNNLLENAYGIDKVIKDIQSDLYSELSSVWSGKIEGYGRVYKNRVEIEENLSATRIDPGRVYLPEWYNSKKKGYEDIYFNDNSACTFCFLTNDNESTSDEFVYQNTTKIVFCVNLEKIHPTIKERSDALAVQDVIQILREISDQRFQITGVQKGLTSIFNGYTVEDIKFDNMQPNTAFAVTVDLQYLLKPKCS